MSINDLVVEDQLLALIDVVRAERSPLARLVLAQRLHAKAEDQLRRVMYEAAWQARQTYPAIQVAESTGIDRHRVEYLASRWADAHPELPPLKRKQRVDLGEVLDLRGLAGGASSRRPAGAPSQPTA